jgi:ribonucleoside-triphosphate reductase
LKTQPQKCNRQTEVYSRVCGFFRPTKLWNKGKKEEFKDRQEYSITSFSGSFLQEDKEKALA